MSVTLSLFAGVGAQFLDNNGVILSGGLIYTYSAGTTTPLATYTTNLGTVAQPNPIILDAAGRIPSGELWLTTGFGYKFVTKDANGVLIGTYDNVPSSAQPPIINDASSISYEQGNSTIAGLFIVGQSYLITFVGTTNFQAIGASANQIGVYFIATGTGSGTGTAQFSRTVQAKFQEVVSVKDFGAIGNGSTDDTVAIQKAFSSGATIITIPVGVYLLSSTVTVPTGVTLSGYGQSCVFKAKAGITITTLLDISNTNSVNLENFVIDANDPNANTSCILSINVTNFNAQGMYFKNPTAWGLALSTGCSNITLTNCHGIGGAAGVSGSLASFLFGSTYLSPSPCDNVLITNCTATSTSSARNGFMSECGKKHIYQSCYVDVAYAGFKIKTNITTLSNCTAINGSFATQDSIYGLVMNGNISYNNSGSGFGFSQLAGSASEGWNISNNMSINGGQSNDPNTPSYGFNFDFDPSATLDGLIFCNNTAMNTVGNTSQKRGFSFGNGIITNVIMSNNIAKNNTADYINGGALKYASTLQSYNIAKIAGNSPDMSFSPSDLLYFFSVPIVANTVVTVPQGFSTPYKMRSSGYIKSLDILGDGTCTAGLVEFSVIKNGTYLGPALQINTSNPVNSSVSLQPFLLTFNAGDVITINASSNSAFLPSGAISYNVVVTIVFNI